MFRIEIDAPGSLAITRRPRGGEWLGEEIEQLAQDGIDILVSLLSLDEIIELGLEQEGALCAVHGLDFISLPIPDMGRPEDTEQFLALVARLTSSLRAGKSIAVHCRLSIGRSGVLATSIAIALGAKLDDALDLISRARGMRVPESAAQREWLTENEERLSGLRV